MGSITIDESRRPIVTVRFVGAVSDGEFDEYLAAMERMLERRQKTLTILDARESARTPPTQRRKQAEWLKAQTSMLQAYSCGSAFVITSPLVRGVLTAILWVQPLPVPHTVVGSITDAEAWARKRLLAEGVTPPPPL
jgi:hypothetical protein